MLVFTGDVNLTDSYFNLGFGIGSSIEKGFNPFKHIERRNNDIWIGNFEGVASTYSINKGYRGKVFRIAPEALNSLHHFDIYGLANNHAMQHGEDAYKETSESIVKYGARYFGSNSTKTIIIKHCRKDISLTAISFRVDEFSQAPSYWHNPEYSEISDELKTIPSQCFKVLYLHWGNEFINRPSSSQKKLAHWLIDIGFDMIIGMHPHVLQGYEIYNGKYIFYSLGNFVFRMPWSNCRYGAIVKLDVSSPIISPIIDYVQIGDDGAPYIVQEKDIPNLFHFKYLNAILQKEENSEQYHSKIRLYYKSYRKSNHKAIIQNIISHPSIAKDILFDFIKRRF